MSTYIEKRLDPATGEYEMFRHSCEVIRKTGKESLVIKIYGTFYNNRPNAIVTVRKWNVIGYDSNMDSNMDNVKLPYKD